MPWKLSPEDLEPQRWFGQVLPQVISGEDLDWSEVPAPDWGRVQPLLAPLTALGLSPEALAQRLGLATMPPGLKGLALGWLGLTGVQEAAHPPPRDPFRQLEQVQSAFRGYAESFVLPRNPRVYEAIRRGVEEESLLWREPFLARQRRYLLGPSVDQLIQQGLLPPEARPLLRKNPEDFQDPEPIRPYWHQYEALEAASRGESFVVATGTGSGKSLAFGLPILAYALRERRPGIKALIVYPMNALANSQYRDFALRLHGSGLCIALYNGDTPVSRKEGQALRERLAQERPVSDAEVLSREEIRQNPPDILMTNYVQLELLLTRGEDRLLFPPEHRGVLRYLVLDEVHTYAGLRGADVALLIRRLKQHTGTTQTLQVIGTSATVDRGEEAIRRFASQLFGVPVERVIGERHEAPPPLDWGLLPAPLREQVEGQEEAVVQALAFLEEALAEPRTLSELAQGLAQQAGLSQELARSHLELALRVGAATGRLVPRIHAFYAQAPELTATLDLSALSLRGERFLNDKPAYPVVLCRNCGQEYLVARLEGGHYLPGPSLLQPFSEGVRYLRPVPWNPKEEPPPEDWLDGEGRVRRDKEPLLPVNLSLDPYTGQESPEGVAVAVLPYPFQFCPTCQVAHSRRGSEIRKLSAFGLVGRSTATDVLLLATLSSLPPEERKVIVFTDNRQDAEFQAAHFQDLFRKVLFRQTVLEVLQGGPVYLGALGDRVYEVWRQSDPRPEATPLFDLYAPEGLAYRQLLSLAAVLEATRNTQPNLKNLEAAGLVRYRYRHLDRLLEREEVWSKAGELPQEVRRDFLVGFLDLMRRRGAFYHPLLDPWRFRLEVEEKLFLYPQEVFVELVGAALVLEYPQGSAPRYGHTFRLYGERRPSLFEAWAMATLRLSWEEARALLKRLVSALKEPELGLLKAHSLPAWGRGQVHGLVLSPNAVQVEATGGRFLYCPRSTYTGDLEALRLSPEYPAQSLEEREVHPFYQELYGRRSFSTPLEARAHSGQVAGEERRRLEERFRDPQDPLAVLVATPTLEMGIDIGALSSVFLRNIPPSPASYAQRSGRAGRKGQPALVQAFAGASGHDAYFYRYPEKMVRGTIEAPRFLLDNPRLLKAHVRALVLEVLAQGGFSLPHTLKDAVDVEDLAGGLPLKAAFRQDLAERLHGSREGILEAVRQAFAEEMGRFPWFTGELVAQVVDGFVGDLDQELGPWRQEFQDAQGRYAEYTARLRGMGPKHPLLKEMQEEVSRAETQRAHLVDLDLRDYLAGRGFLPNYAFARALSWAELLEPGREVRRLERPPFIALTELAPGNAVYYRGRRYTLERAAFLPKRASLERGKRCTCGHVETLGNTCRACGKDLSSIPPAVLLSPLPVTLGVPRRRIASDEEERTRLGYEVAWDYRKASPRRFRSGEVVLLYEHNAQVVALNKGLKAWMGDEGDKPLSGGFVVCERCRRFLLSEKELEEHPSREGKQGRCPASATPEDLMGNLVFQAEAEADTLALEVPLPPGMDRSHTVPFYKSLLAAFRKAALVTLELADDELFGFIQPLPRPEAPFRVVLVEGQEGGLGALAALAAWPGQEVPHPLHRLAQTALRLMHEGEEGCERACYKCLMDYANQPDHALLDRNLVLPFFRWLQEAQFTPEEDGEHLERLLKACESELERRWLREAKRRGFPLPEEAQHPFPAGDTFTRFDFFYRVGVGVYVDGPSHQDPERAQLDRRLREALALQGVPFVVFREGEDWGRGFAELAALLERARG
ncbi:DEAD/DEAH box helicase [Thermus caliditerrae]|uniref:DEAD/DEAH box helicase n=1 Tax=Thermus caliditerrae TaxID=1330700 RepID=UPI0009DDDB63|nr:DEAD/DEAH box helicase [Thermus caliditerrae]